MGLADAMTTQTVATCECAQILIAIGRFQDAIAMD
jgi:hypothetical protein